MVCCNWLAEFCFSAVLTLPVCKVIAVIGLSLMPRGTAVMKSHCSCRINWLIWLIGRLCFCVVHFPPRSLRRELGDFYATHVVSRHRFWWSQRSRAVALPESWLMPDGKKRNRGINTLRFYSVPQVKVKRTQMKIEITQMWRYRVA